MSASWRVEIFGSLPSTQDALKEKALAGEPEFYAVQSLTQTAGRGRQGNEWDSPIGNLYLSALLRPDCKADEGAQLSYVAGLALSEAINPYIDTKKHVKTLKWPNDVLIGGLKVAGILLESDISPRGRVNFMMIGTGVNILSPPEGRAGLESIKEKPIYINIFRDEYLTRLTALYELWKEKGFAPIRESWLKQAHGLGGPMSVRLGSRQEEGTFKGVDKNGSLLLSQKGGGTRTIRAGEVYFR